MLFIGVSGPKPPSRVRRRPASLHLHVGVGVEELIRDEPDTRVSGKNSVILARYARNRRLGDPLYGQDFTSLNSSPGAPTTTPHGVTHHQALHALGNRLVGILHDCLRPRSTTKTSPEPQLATKSLPRQLDSLDPWDD